MTTQALLNFNGVNGTQVFTDETGNQSWVVSSGNPVLDTSQKKYGTASLRLDAVSNSSIETSLANPITGDFTIEYWVNHDALVGGERSWFSLPNLSLNCYNDVSVDYLRLIIQGQSFIMDSFYNSGIQEWVHLALCRKDGRIFGVYNGLIFSLPYVFTETITDFVLGANKLFVTDAWVYSRPMKGYVDSLRISDVCLYNTNDYSTYLSLTEPGLTPTPNSLTMRDDFYSVLFSDRIYGLYFKGNDLENHMLIVCGAAIGGGGGGVPTSTNIISGNVKKLGLPFELKVVAVSVEFTPVVVGHSVSDSVTGDYSIDVYPWDGDTLVYAVQNYGIQFNPESSVTAGQIVHPTIPNKNIFVAQNTGLVGGSEPPWPDSGNIVSGAVTFTAEPLYRPLMNGFLKPTVTVI